MFQGNWTCCKCSGVITELPFEPKSEKGLTCRDCFLKQTDKTKSPSHETRTSNGALDDRDVPPFDPDVTSAAGEQTIDSPHHANAPVAEESTMFEGSWTCATCGAAITKLPFEPRGTENLKCIDCFKKAKSA